MRVCAVITPLTKKIIILCSIFGIYHIVVSGAFVWGSGAHEFVFIDCAPIDVAPIDCAAIYGAPMYGAPIDV